MTIIITVVIIQPSLTSFKTSTTKHYP